MSSTPRKFSEKIALQQQKLAEQQRAFESVMREVEDVTKKKGSPPLMEPYYGTGYPNAGRFSNIQDYSSSSVPASRSIDLSGALKNLKHLTKQGPASFDCGTSHDASFQVPPGDPNNSFFHSGRPGEFVDQRHWLGNMASFDQSQTSPFLKLPFETTWIRSQSDSSIHTTVMAGPAASFTQPEPTVNADYNVNNAKLTSHIPKNRSPATQVSDYSSTIPYGPLEPRMALLTMESGNPMLPEPSFVGTDSETYCNFESEYSEQVEAGNTVLPLNNEGQRISNNNNSASGLSTMPNQVISHSPGYEWQNFAASSNTPLIRPSQVMRVPNMAVVGAVGESGLLFNASSMPDLRAALAYGNPSANGFPVKDPHADLSQTLRLPNSRIQKHRAMKHHLRQQVLGRNSPSGSAYLNGGRSASHADMAALTRQRPDMSMANVNFAPSPFDVQTHQNIQSAVSQQIHRQQTDSSLPDNNSPYAEYRSPPLIYQGYTDAKGQPMSDINQPIPEICIETADDQFNSQRMQPNSFSPSSAVSSQFSPTGDGSSPSTNVYFEQKPVYESSDVPYAVGVDSTVLYNQSSTQQPPQQIYVSSGNTAPSESQVIYQDWLA